MYLKSIEIQGFKSFPVPTRLPFDKPVTAIVGPNGSGKSNISDAILWVMGEQSSKTLRGGKMEDVIFGGTLIRPQQNFAEVSLILDNSDNELGIEASEVMLTRRYYRSGESEYYINQSSVRLKEITELLMDTGLGREGYSVIGQGRIAEILSVKSKDRREIFEEAAGISKFRHKKDEAERKLHGTEENLLRIGDRIAEIELQYEPLREKAENERMYNALIGELKGVEISLWLKELETIGARTEKAENDHLAAKRELDAANLDYNEAYKEQENLANVTKESDIDAQTARDQISETERNKNEVDNSIAVLGQKLESNTEQIEHIKAEIKSHEAQHDGVGAEINENDGRLAEINRLRDEKNGEINAIDKSFSDIVSSANSGEIKHQELLDKENRLLSKYNEKKSELSALAAGAQELMDTEASAEGKLAEAVEECKEREEDCNKHAQSLKEAADEITSLENVIQGLNLKAESRGKKAAATGEVLERLVSQFKSMETRHALLSDMEKEYQGYTNSVKTIMQEHSRGALKNIHGTVGSMVKTDDSYTVAIETALRSAIQNIIVDTEEDAKAAMNLLKNRNAGIATFQPISTVKGTALNEADFKNDEGFIGLAIDLVTFDKKYTGIYTYLLGRIAICDNLTHAIAMAKRHSHKVKIVTLDGQQMNVGGSMTGGSTAANAGVLTRANELSQLSKRIEALKTDIDKAEREHAERVREKTAAEFERDTAAEQLQRMRESYNIKVVEHNHREENIKTLRETIGTLRSERKNIGTKIEQNSADTKRVSNEISKLESELNAVKNSIDEAVKDNEQLKGEREKLNSQRNNIMAELAALNAEWEATSVAVAKLRDIREQMTGSRQSQLDTIAELEKRNEEIRDLIVVKERESQDLRDLIEKQKERLSNLDTRRLEVEEKRNKMSTLLNEKFEKITQKQGKVTSLEIKLEAIRGEEALIVDRLFTTYGLGRSAAEQHGIPIESVASAKKRTNAIKRELDKLGTPYIGAIKEFERVSERYEYYTSQRDDVLKAKAELTDIIDKITAQMKDIFIREFELINESFKRTFKELFRGGRALLRLEDPEDVLNCGIEIEAQPPGKALSTLTLLSGGEKALVAITIYFAILSVRPPPFVIMDEIDTALDDANVVRFADYMRYMSERTQMIVITHKRGTMEGADVIYGITMQELGVSNLISLDLNEAEKHINSKVSV